MSSNKCPTCKKGFHNNCFRLHCETCSHDFHLPCEGVSKVDYATLVAEAKPWACTECRKPRCDMTAQSSDTSTTVSSEFRDIVTDVFNKFRESFLKEFNALCEIWSEKLDSCIANCRSTNKDLNALSDRVKVLENRLVDMEQASFSKDIEIQGVPFEREEDLTKLVSTLGEVVGCRLQPDDIDYLYRVRQKPTSRSVTNVNSGRIILRFSRMRTKVAYLKAARSYRGLSVNNIGWPGSKDPIYVNERLTFEKRRLLAKAKEYKRDKNFKYCWLRNGSVFLRKDDGDPVLLVKCESDLANL